jgi:dihydrodipicolinate synthase/N-acetylneuraminate lyase
MTETIKLAGDRLKGVMSAWQGNNIITEYERGACGATVACHLVDVYVRLWNALEAGNRMEAREIYKRMLPMINYDLMYTPWLYKEVLYRRGLIPNTHTRYDVQRMDRFDLKHVEEILADLREFMAVK